MALKFAAVCCLLVCFSTPSFLTLSREFPLSLPRYLSAAVEYWTQTTLVHNFEQKDCHSSPQCNKVEGCDSLFHMFSKGHGSQIECHYYPCEKVELSNYYRFLSSDSHSNISSNCLNNKSCERIHIYLRSNLDACEWKWKSLPCAEKWCNGEGESEN